MTQNTAASGGTSIRFENVSKTFASGKRLVTAVDNVSLDIPSGEIFAMIGYSGAGKSTLLRMINGLERPTSGRVLVGGAEVSSLPERQLRAIRADVGMVFQQFNLFRSRTVAGNVAYPLKVAGWPAAKRAARVAELLDFVGLADKAKHYPDQLSGGQKQRVGVARALASGPSVLLADEATSALDPETTKDVLGLLRSVNTEFGVTIVAITHSMSVVRALADRVAVLANGAVVETGTVFDIFANPRSDISRNFVSTVLRHAPDSQDLARIARRHAGTIVSVEIRDDVQIGRLLSEAARGGVGFEVVHGGVSSLQSRVFGNLSLELQGPPEGVARLVGELKAATKTIVAQEALP
ncbi:ABC transporter related protein [Segniliparus rotundus DSM 44985]|uniref:ABC transporter related protein n=1 Tax=Segniliparus rotundus (strain ATCC BAA-972 / CDC 1076 / CIP 108378 / DSM 44985 / JCM 13578) TaxID=640132 RepID=D6Z9R7_SEGRD|nr:methionine ABC transporter ATP-binding protein [Segniliparus rotundus]ADG96594.1 ABC transporter related protein [Segniliparus rotundus DSM 44985]